MTFSSSNKCARAYIGNWQAVNFGSPVSSLLPPHHTPTSPTASPSSPSAQDSEPKDPFKTWTGPLIYLYARDGSVHLSYIGEDTSSTFSKVMRSIKEGFLGTGGEDEEHGGQAAAVTSSPPTLLLPRGAAMQAYRSPPTLRPHPEPHRPHPQFPPVHPHSRQYQQARSDGQGAQGRQYAQLPEPSGPGLFEDPRDKRGYDRKVSQ
jgi:hypothetical protein